MKKDKNELETNVQDLIKEIKLGLCKDAYFIEDYLSIANEEHKRRILEALHEKHREVMEEWEATKKKAAALLAELEGTLYLEIGTKRYNLVEWLTPSDYAVKYSIKSAQLVNDWISSGKITPKNTIKVPQLGIQLVRDIPF